MNEIAPSAHVIMSPYLATRPIYRPTGRKNEQGQEEWVIDGYDDVEQVSLGLQHTFAIKKTSHFAAKGFWISNELKSDDNFKTFMSWKDRAGLMTAALDVVRSCFTTGDGAIYLYSKGKNIEWQVFSRNYGDILYPDEDESRNPVLYRQYTYKGKKAVDVFSVNYRETWVQDDLDEDNAEQDEQPNWLQKMLGLAKKNQREVSEDGYRLLIRENNQVGSDYIQAIYFRVNDIPSGVAQGSIETLERALSYVCDEVKASAFPTLFVKSGGIKSLPPMDAHGKVIAVNGDPETVKNSDAKYLTKQDISNIATLNISKLTENIIRTTMSVFVEPEILKQGSDSSTTMKLMFNPEVQWCQNMWPQFYHPFKRLVEVFKRLVGIVEGKATEFAELRLSIGLDVWLPQNEGELIDQVTKLVYAGILSQENAANEIGLDYIDDMEKVRKEAEDKLYRDSYIPVIAKAEAEAKYGVPVSEEVVVGESESNPELPPIDNNAQNKNIATSKQ